jgi:hypothetical protein
MMGTKQILFSAIAAAVIGIGGLATSAKAQAYTPGYAPAPVYVTPARVYVPAPVYAYPPAYVVAQPQVVVPAPVVVYPAPAYCPPPRVYQPQPFFGFTYRNGGHGHDHWGINFGFGGW